MWTVYSVMRRVIERNEQNYNFESDWSYAIYISYFRISFIFSFSYRFVPFEQTNHIEHVVQSLQYKIIHNIWKKIYTFDERIKKEICSNCFATRMTIRFLGCKREFERDLFRVDRENTYRFFANLIIEINKCLNCFSH